MPTRYHIMVLLQNINLKIFLDSPNNNYQFEYSTNKIKNSTTGAIKYIRTYRLIDLTRGAEILEPWDKYNLKKQIELVSNLIKFSNYKISKITTGWMIKCSMCHTVMQGNIWDTIPKKCRGKEPICRHRITDNDIEEKLLSYDFFL